MRWLRWLVRVVPPVGMVKQRISLADQPDELMKMYGLTADISAKAAEVLK